MVTTVKEYNDNQEKEYQEFCQKCIDNGVSILPFDRYFFKFGYKRGFVAWGKYPIYSKLRRNLKIHE